MVGERQGLVGRSGDLARISVVLDLALADEPGTILILGEAGVGKTTTLHEATNMAAQRGFVTATGSCSDGDSGTSFAPFRVALRGLVSAYDDRAVVAALEGRPAASVLLPAPWRATTHSPAASDDAGELYDAVLGLLSALAAERPLLLALEDLHWADRSTLELLSFVARNLTAERAVLVGTVRSEDVPADDPAGRSLTELARLTSTTRLELRGLDAAAFGELVAGAGVVLDAGAVATLHHRTGGNPFYALELLAAGAAASGPVPPSVTDAIAIRLGRLASDDLAVVRAAAVAGMIDVPLLTSMLGLDEHGVEASLRAAVAAGVLATDLQSGDVRFRHALLREVAYCMLLTSERRRLHEAAAGALARRHDADAALLAHHYAAANSPADALRTSIVAAREAAGAYGSVDAVDHYVRAVRTWNVVPPSERPSELTYEDLLQEAMLCAVNVGANDEGAVIGARLLDSLDPARDPERWGMCAARLSELRWELGDSTSASSLLDRAEHYLEGRPDSVARVRVLERRAFQAVLASHREEGLDLARATVRLARQTGDTEAVVVAMNRVALASTALGEIGANVLLRDAFEEAWRARLPHEVTRSAVNMLLLLHTGCRLDEAIDAGERVLAAVDDLGIGPSAHAVLAALYARSLVDAGNWERADELLAGIRLPNAPRFRAYVAISVAELAVARGDTDLAHRMVGESRFDAVFVLSLRRACLEAELAMADGDLHVARAIADQYLPVAEMILDSSYVRLAAFAMRSLPHGETDAADTYLRNAEQRDTIVSAMPAGATADHPAWLAVIRAAHALVHRVPASRLWSDASARFDSAGLIVRRAWAQIEQAAAMVDESDDRVAATHLVAEAHALAVRLGAEPVRRYAESLVRRARLDVPGIARLAQGDLGLTERETEVLRLVAAGRTNREIADTLFISVKTASVHVSNILRKVGAATRGEAAAIAHREGLAGETSRV